jgi:hypothetical protein
MLSRYKQVDRPERNAIIRQIDALLPVLSGDEKAFWLKFRRELEKLNELPTGVKVKKCTMRCGDPADYDGKYCWTCIQRLAEDSQAEIESEKDFGDDPICKDAPF